MTVISVNSSHGSSKASDILLISMQNDLDTVGLKSLHATLLDKGYTSILLYIPDVSADGPAWEAADNLITFIAGNAPGIIGISLMSHEYARAVSLTRFLKRHFPDTAVVWGGIHPTVAPAMSLDHADYVCVGEGESAVLDLMQAVRGGATPAGVPNFWYKEDGRVVKSPLKPLVTDLDSLPVPDHIPANSFIVHRRRVQELNRPFFKKYARWRGTVYSVMGSRGCPFACAYCCNDFYSKLYGSRHTIRRRQVTALIEEIAGAVSRYPGIQYVNFHDDCFLACSDDYLEAFCHQYKERVGIPFIVRCIPKFFTERKMRYLKAAGVAWISIGLQSASNRVLTGVYNRHSTVADFLRASALIHRFRVAVYYDVILDNPLEREAEKLSLVPVLSGVPKPYFLQLFSLVLYPGTVLYDRMIPLYPEKAREYLTKDYHTYQNNKLNRLIRISGYLPTGVMERLVAGYRRNPGKASFRLTLITAAMVSAIVLEPLTYFRLIRRSLGNNTLSAVMMLPAFFRVGFSRYVKQFLPSGRRDGV
ncbi:MAG: radical SAM protein [Thermodesulfobacteriota bacterium]|nr:radical SAM protein [Thermodesulfobacteriota bacterium]